MGDFGNPSKSIVVVGSCMIDFISYCQRLPKPGETLIGTSFDQSFGGKGANQCVAAAKLGASTTLVASLGSDIFGKEYLDALKKHNVNVSHVYLQKDTTSGIAQISVDNNGENCIVIVPGANLLLKPDLIDKASDIIKKANVLVCQFETPVETSLHAVKLFKGHGISIVNGAPAIPTLDLEIIKSCDIFCVNETEAEIMTGMESISLSNIQQAVDKLLDAGCNTVIITLGASGAVYASSTDRTAKHVASEKVIPIDTTGAGDAFIGALAYYLAHHVDLDLGQAIKRACSVAAQSVLKPGTQKSFPMKTDLPERLFL